MIFRACGTFGTNRACIMRQDNTMSKQTETSSTWSTSPRSSVGCAQKDFYAHGTFVANRSPILHRHWLYLWMDQNKHPLDLGHLRVPLGAPKKISLHVVHSTQTGHLFCTEINTFYRLKRASTWPTHEGVPPGVFKMISEPILCSAKTVHLSCAKINTISKRTQTSFTWPTSPRSSIGCI
jgi:hypothetical protein